ncbi:hypothetical protein GCM10009785_23000 [Brooklawnia cerclae]|uniref:Dinitrogenase iron-molybdenum cofactor biosynthesis domain-containing protein n=1 Tax=Brooklawnia cerclae TaxID=349934 RepID=A0ABX0SF96_9ACTN|nr:NifB/NifX family molybdenum-iron cluster-binding protein [Brooklawnia cerclae]NIH57065.1 hypothetical protein [Brooklawnia cerclae]
MEYRIAVASSDGIHIDQHFAEVSDFLVLVVDSDRGETRTEGRRRAPAVDAAEGETGRSVTCIGTDIERLGRTGELLADCRYLLTVAIGRKPQAVLLRHGIDTLETDGTLDAVIPQLNKYVVGRSHARAARACCPDA